ncbi:hypothetical protein BDF19DRAFT_412946 [Syncephalis fuscata]|nr:hypothetical protein BDF19DRAFT_412946 [Syncephalis fuscata]
MAFKNLTRLRQWTGERLGMSSKTETSEEFRKLEHEIDLKHDFVDNISTVAELYMNSLVKRTKSDKYLLMESLGITMSTLGSQLGNDSEYGKSLVKTGDGFQKLAETQVQYSVKLKAGFMDSLARAKDEIKDYQARRLDFDSKTNKVQKSKRERPELEEDMRAAQSRYEEAMADTHNKMVAISELEETQHRDLVGFVEAQLDFFREGLEIMTTVKQALGDPVFAESKRRTSQAEESNIEPSDTQSIHSAYASRVPHSPITSTASTLANPLRQPSYQAAATPPASIPRAPVAPVAAPATNERYMEALYNYDGADEDELSIVKGDKIAVVEEIDEGWWVGEIRDGGRVLRRGMFPANYCKPCNPPTVTAAAIPPAPPAPVAAVVSPPAPVYPSIPQVASAASVIASAVSAPRPPYARQSSVASTGHASGSSSAPPPRPTGAKPPTMRPMSATATPPQPVTSTPSNHAYLPASVMDALNGPPSSAVGPCGECGCNEFSPNVFKKGSCNNCFHKH